MSGNALIVGAGAGLSASVARALKREGYAIALAARNTDKLAGLAGELDARTYSCDVAEETSVADMFKAYDDDNATLDVVMFNPSARARGPLVELAPEDVKRTLEVSAYGGFLIAQQAAMRMLKQGSGTILLTGASASVKGYPQSAPFAMGKFALRGLAQSMARELHPRGVHVAHFVIDGGIASDSRPNPDNAPAKFLDPDAIADAYLGVLKQHPSAWAWEIELRPSIENF